MRRGTGVRDARRERDSDRAEELAGARMRRGAGVSNGPGACPLLK